MLKEELSAKPNEQNLLRSITTFQKTSLSKKKSRLIKLAPRLDEESLIRCDRRLRFAEFLS